MRLAILALGSVAASLLAPLDALADSDLSASVSVGRSVLGDSKYASWSGGHPSIRVGVYRRIASSVELGTEAAYTDFGRLAEVCLACDGCPCPSGRGGQGGGVATIRWRPSLGRFHPCLSAGAGANAIRFYGYFQGFERPDLVVLPAVTAAAGIQGPFHPALGIEARWESTRRFHYYRFDLNDPRPQYDLGNVDLYTLLLGLHFN
jgi:hypothetical protein